LGFDGSEIYFKDEAKLIGKTYNEALLWYENSAVIGIQTADGNVLINPPMDKVFNEGDLIMAITEDDDTLIIGKQKGIFDSTKIKSDIIIKSATEKTLILGWNHRGKAILRELNNYVLKGSEISIAANCEQAETDTNEIQNTYQNFTIGFIKSDTTDRNVIELLKPELYDHIIVLSYVDEMDIQQADAKTLITLLQLRHYAKEKNIDLNIVSEMMDVRNRELASVTKADDFIVSDKMISLLIAQVSENKSLMRVYNDLFQDEGSEIYIKSVSNYIEIGVPVNFYSVVESAARKNESAFGYCIASESFNSSKLYGVNINPSKSEMITFADGDRIIVMAED
jgi:hypothetical protein